MPCCSTSQWNDRRFQAFGLESRRETLRSDVSTVKQSRFLICIAARENSRCTGQSQVFHLFVWIACKTRTKNAEKKEWKMLLEMCWMCEGENNKTENDPSEPNRQSSMTSRRSDSRITNLETCRSARLSSLEKYEGSPTFVKHNPKSFPDWRFEFLRWIERDVDIALLQQRN